MSQDTAFAQTALPSSFDSTHMAPSSAGVTTALEDARPTFSAPASAARTTVLPKVDGDGTTLQLSLESRSRYEPTKLLGAGGMGEVILVKDHDIDRRVAVKRLLPEMTDPALLARFVDEIRCVGRLEHPNIVPIHDVGVDELGRYFFVMKYVEGETLEHIIEKIAAGDQAYLRKYTLEARIEIIIGLLNALAYAHEQGIVHRDIKPANIMVGHYGEVVLMDWGIAKPLAATRDGARGAEGTIEARSTSDDGSFERTRMYATRVGALIGTPAYMAPEQARGDIDKVDIRSDLYSASVVFLELLTGRHYLADKTTLDELLAGVITWQGNAFTYFFGPNPPPIEFCHLIAAGMQNDPALRIESAQEYIFKIQQNQSGRIKVQCPYTATKRFYRELGRLMDRRPGTGVLLLMAVIATTVFGLVSLTRMVLA